MAKPPAPAGPPTPDIVIDAPFIRLVADRGAEPIELNAFAIVAVAADGTGAHVTTASGDPAWAHRYVAHEPAAVKRAIRTAMRRIMASPAAPPKPAVAMPVKSLAERLDEIHGRG